MLSFNQAVTLDTSSVKSMDSFLINSDAFNQPIFFDSGSVTTMHQMFKGMALFDQSVVALDTSSVATMEEMFENADDFTQHVAFDCGAATTMKQMFGLMALFNGALDLDTTLVTDMREMFEEADAFDQAVSLDTASVTTMFQMFYHADAFNQPVSFDTRKVTTMYGMFDSAIVFDQAISFDTGSVTTLEQMFEVASAFDSPLLFDTRLVQDMGYMLRNAASFDQPLSFDVSSVTSIHQMFDGTTSLSDCNKRAIEDSLSVSSAWTYDWSSLCTPSPPPSPSPPSPSPPPPSPSPPPPSPSPPLLQPVVSDWVLTGAFVMHAGESPPYVELPGPPNTGCRRANTRTTPCLGRLSPSLHLRAQRQLLHGRHPLHPQLHGSSERDLQSGSHRARRQLRLVLHPARHREPALVGHWVPHELGVVERITLRCGGDRVDRSRLVAWCQRAPKRPDGPVPRGLRRRRPLPGHPGVLRTFRLCYPDTGLHRPRNHRLGLLCILGDVHMARLDSVRPRGRHKDQRGVGGGRRGRL
jgi:hypothetical protein